MSQAETTSLDSDEVPHAGVDGVCPNAMDETARTRAAARSSRDDALMGSSLWVRILEPESAAGRDGDRRDHFERHPERSEGPPTRRAGGVQCGDPSSLRSSG